jgi:hypothetical protein
MFTAPEAGNWTVSAWWPILREANPATRIEIETAGSGPGDPTPQVTTTTVDQHLVDWRRTRATAALALTPTWWPLPAAFDLAQNDYVKVRVFRRSDTRGHVIADAFRFLRT